VHFTILRGEPRGRPQGDCYNWQTNSWDIIRLTQSASDTTQNAKAYLSPDGRILVQYVNQASDFSDIAFTKPSLTVTGIAAQS
jgi:hypothetical protein